MKVCFLRGELMIPNQWSVFKGMLGPPLPTMIWIELGMGHMRSDMGGKREMETGQYGLGQGW